MSPCLCSFERDKTQSLSEKNKAGSEQEGGRHFGSRGSRLVSEKQEVLERRGCSLCFLSLQRQTLSFVQSCQTKIQTQHVSFSFLFFCHAVPDRKAEDPCVFRGLQRAKLRVGREFEMVRGSGTDVEFLKVFLKEKSFQVQTSGNFTSPCEFCSCESTPTPTREIHPAQFCCRRRGGVYTVSTLSLFFSDTSASCGGALPSVPAKSSS